MVLITGLVPGEDIEEPLQPSWLSAILHQERWEKLGSGRTTCGGPWLRVGTKPTLASSLNKTIRSLSFFFFLLLSP